jgi:ATP-dependent helicase Lhr and Lhr-like helicase
VQELTTHAILDGDNCVVLAPTAGGKTEAAFLPLLSRMGSEDWSAPSVIYLSPIKALLNNQEPRMERLAGMLSRRVFKWHGDVNVSVRGRFAHDPADILMTTPESLEVMLVSSRVPSRRLFRALEAVVIDEVHAFAGDDRGAHLVSLLERLQRHAGRDVQRIGLSATVGNPQEILAWLGGTSRRPARLVDPPKPAASPDVRLDWVATLPNAARVISELDPGKKRLAFVDSRRRVEQLGEALQATGTATFLMHSSLSADERREAERAFESGGSCVIVATSTMELGIDIGDLDAVYQIDAPPSVASFLQRMGRTGRRAGAKQSATILCTKASELALSAALLRLWASGYVEPVQPERAAFHVLAQQLLALCLQENGVPVMDWWAWLAGAACFADVTPRERETLLARMLEAGILVSTEARLILGPRGEALYARKNFQALYAVFEAPPLLSVRWGAREVGSIDALFLQALPPASCFVLGGRPWQIAHVDWKRGLCEVAPAPDGKHLNWFGKPKLIARRLCQEVQQTLRGGDEDPWWTKRARETRIHLGSRRWRCSPLSRRVGYRPGVTRVRRWNLVVLALLFAYYGLDRFLPLGAWNGQRAFLVDNGQVALDLVVLAVLAGTIVGVRFAVRPLMALGAAVLVLWCILHLETFWIPYARGVRSLRERAFHEQFLEQIQLLPRFGDHLPPDGEHLVIDLLVLPATLLTALAAVETLRPRSRLR